PVQATDIAVQADGKILCTGGLVNFNVQTIAFRLLQNGGIDSAFGQNGHALCVNNAYCHSKSGGEAIVIQPDGRFIIGGNLFLASGLHMTAVRYSSNGIPDSSFGSNGIC